MTIDELQEAARAMLAEATRDQDRDLHAIAAVVDQLADFIEGAVFRHLSNAGVQEQSERDRAVGYALVDHLKSIVLHAASAPMPEPEDDERH